MNRRPVPAATTHHRMNVVAKFAISLLVVGQFAVGSFITGHFMPGHGSGVARADDAAQAARPLRIATFRADVTPPVGAPLCLGLVSPVNSVADPLSARGIVLLADGGPIVLCAVDYVLINNASHDAWVQALAEAAETRPDRVAVQSLHQHDAPGLDADAAALLEPVGLGDEVFDRQDAAAALRRTADALRASLAKAQTVTHIGLGTGRVERVASNRRVLGEDGKVAIVRYSASRNPAAWEAPEGTIDPQVQQLAFFDGSRPVASLTWYATHPQSYYGRGEVSADFVGAARALREQAEPEVFHLHFNGAGGNVTAGKYNDGSPQRRPELAARLAAGMEQAWGQMRKLPLNPSDVSWKVQQVALPLRDLHDADRLRALIADPQQTRAVRMRAARDLAYVQRVQAGRRLTLSCLQLGTARVLHMPGELFVEYQLHAQQLYPGFVALAAYGDGGPGYIGTAISYTQGGYETGVVSRTAPESEPILHKALRDLLQGD